MKNKLSRLINISTVSKNEYKPFIYKLKNASDKEKFQKLIDENEGLLIYDQILSQVEEFVKLRNPKTYYSKSDLTQAAIDYLNDNANGSWEDYGAWVFYKWSNRLVHILDEKEFAEVRTNRNQYKITPEERDILSKKKVGIIGLSVGQSVALTMAMERSFGELRIGDFDLLELSNLNRIRSGVQNLGLKKVVMVAREIAEIDPYLNVIIFPEGIHEENLDEFMLKGGKLDMLIEECDSLDIKIKSRIKAKEYKIPVVMDTSDRGMIDVERFDLDSGRPILHGLLEHLDLSKILEAKTFKEKMPFILPILGIETVSSRMKASMLEVGESITTWPQLASAVTLGGGVTADVYRRIALGQFSNSGRYFVDIEEIIGSKEISGTPKRTSNSITEEQMMIEINNFKSQNSPHQIDLNIKTVEELVTAAKSTLNNEIYQNWVWKYHNRSLYIFLRIDPENLLSDFQEKASLISIGKAAENIILKSHELNLEVCEEVSLTTNSCLMAIFKFFERNDSLEIQNLETHLYDNLSGYIDRRLNVITNNSKIEISKERFQFLKSLVETDLGNDLKIFDDNNKLVRVAELAARAYRILLMIPNGFKIIKNYIENNTRSSSVSPEILGLLESSEWDLLKDWSVVKLLKEWGLGNGLGKSQSEFIINSSALGVLVLPSNEPLSFYKGGRILERIYLGAVKEKISVSPVLNLTAMLNMFSFSNELMLSDKVIKEFNLLKEQVFDMFSIQSNTASILLISFNGNQLLER